MKKTNTELLIEKIEMHKKELEKLACECMKGCLNDLISKNLDKAILLIGLIIELLQLHTEASISHIKTIHDFEQSFVGAEIDE